MATFSEVIYRAKITKGKKLKFAPFLRRCLTICAVVPKREGRSKSKIGYKMSTNDNRAILVPNFTGLNKNITETKTFV